LYRIGLHASLHCLRRCTLTLLTRTGRAMTSAQISVVTGAASWSSVDSRLGASTLPASRVAGPLKWHHALASFSPQDRKRAYHTELHARDCIAQCRWAMLLVTGSGGTDGFPTESSSAENLVITGMNMAAALFWTTVLALFCGSPSDKSRSRFCHASPAHRSHTRGVQLVREYAYASYLLWGRSQPAPMRVCRSRWTHQAR
jgi:hypothetical protein